MSSTAQIDKLLRIAFKLFWIQIELGKRDQALKTLDRIRPLTLLRHGNSCKWFANAVDRFQENLRGT